MAYMAPETLTGKYYSEKIDIFSFGVLLCQMCCGEYPRIERREDQQQKAGMVHPPLEQLITQCMLFQPVDRPSANGICEQLRLVKSNDRHYPPARRLPPQSDLGVLCRRWMHEQIQNKCKDTKLALEQTSRRLTVEEQRWRDEADRADKMESTMRELRVQLAKLSESLECQTTETEKAKAEYAESER